MVYIYIHVTDFFLFSFKKSTMARRYNRRFRKTERVVIMLDTLSKNQRVDGPLSNIYEQT